MKRAYFDNLAPMWDNLPAPPDASRRVARFLDEVVRGSEGLILDTGSGTGILLSELRLRAPHAHIVECDFASAMLELARQRGEGRTSYVCADATAPPFAPETFDLVICFNVVPHFADLRGALQALAACLRPDGRLAIGHGMGSDALNALHAQIGGPVGKDVLPTAPEMAVRLAEIGLREIRAHEAPDRYLAEGTR